MTEVLKRQCSKSKKGYNQVKVKSNTIYILMKHLLLTLLLPFTTAHLHIGGEGGQGAGGQRRGGDDFRRVSGSGREEVHPERHQVRPRRLCLRVKHLNQSTSVSCLCLGLMVGFDLQVRGVSVLQSRKQFRLEVLQALTWPSPAPAPVLLLSALPAHHLFLRLVPVTHFFYRAQRIHGADIEQFTQGCSIRSKSRCRIHKLDREGKWKQR